MINGQIVWFEIPVKELDRSMLFYKEVLSVSIEKNKFLEQEYGIFNKVNDLVRGCLAVKEDHQAGTGIILYFYVLELSQSLRNVEKYGGQIIIPKTLLKQKAAEGHVTINSNLIDGNIGYYAEVLDCDGNKICLYSNS